MNIVVLAGGLSPERDVSFSSGTMACNALIGLGHHAVLIDLFFGVPDWDGTDRIFENASLREPYRITASEPDLKAIRASRKKGYNEYIGLKAKVRMANLYLEQVLKHRGKIDSYDIHKVVTWSMLPHVEIVGIEVANMDGLGYVRIREEVA